MELLWALGLSLTLTICRVLALPIDCPLSAEGVSQFFDGVEKRCSPCSVGVCKTFRTLPQPCVCTCFLGDSTTLVAKDTVDGLHIVELTWLSGLTLAFVLSLVGFVLWWGKCPSSKHVASAAENEPLVPNDIKTLNNNNNNAAGCNCPIYPLTSSAPTSSMVQEDKCLKIIEPNSHLVTSPQPGTSLPKQESSDSDETPPKTMLGGERESPVLEVGPRNPKLGLPGHDFRIREIET